MRVIKAEKIKKVVEELCIKANLVLRPDVLQALKRAAKTETKAIARRMLNLTVENARIAKRDKLAICQDTGLPVVFIELGQKVVIQGDLIKAINKGIESGYRRAYLRNSIVKDPISRKGIFRFSPAVIHIDLNNSDKCKITVLPKGFGCENKSKVKMFNPTASLEEIKKFIVETVREAGPDACPPYVVGVGIGGTVDYVSLLAKKALLRKLQAPSSQLPSELLKRINRLNIGPMGLGGKVTALAVKIETYPTHIAGLPVAVNISCHALRSASKTI